MGEVMKYKHPLEPGRPVRLHLVGVGGTGSILAHNLVRLDLAMRALGHAGFSINLWDPDVVELHNIGRQLFTEAEVGMNKAEAMATRLLNAYRVDITPHASTLGLAWGDIAVGCVDTKDARKGLHRSSARWLFDCGNTTDTGQVLMRHPDCMDTLKEFPGLTEGEEDTTPSCSLAESLGRQELFINSTVANACSQMLWQSFRHGGLDYRGVFINLHNQITTNILQ
jgi:PRTRC genetic system ThiF family protein